MTSHKSQSRQSEQTEVGEQTLITGVAPITLREKLALLSAQPMEGPRKFGLLQLRPQKSCNHGLFNEVSCAQIDLLDLISTMETKP